MKRSGSRTVVVRKLLFAFLPLVVLISVAELGLRVIDWPRAREFLHNEVYWRVDPNLDQFPMSHKEKGTAFHVTTNSDGLRTAHSRENSGRRTRIMALGCSTTFGWGVADQETYPARLEQYFRRDGLDIEVINGGQPGYTTFQGLWLWKNVLRHYKPDLVIIGYIAQDGRDAAYSDKSQAILQADGGVLKEPFLYRSKIYLAIECILQALQRRMNNGAGFDQLGEQRVPPEDYEDNLAAFVSGIRDIDADVVFFSYPLYEWGHTIGHRAVLESVADDLHVEYLDGQMIMEKQSSRRRFYFAADDGHANAEGNDMIAQWVYAFLRDYRADW